MIEPYQNIFLLILTIALIIGSGIEIGFICLLGTALYLLSQSTLFDSTTLFAIAALFVPIPLTAYLLGVIAEASLPVQVRRSLTGLIVFIALAAMLQSGYFVEMLVLLAEQRTNLNGISLIEITLAVLSASIFCAFVVGGVVILITILFELSFNSIFSLTKITNPISVSSFRPFVLIGVLCAASNLALTLFISYLHPLSILRLVGAI